VQEIREDMLYLEHGLGLPADDPRQFWYDVNGFQDGVKLRATAGGAVESFVFLVFVLPVIHNTAMFYLRVLVKCGMLLIPAV
jgi:hypothetical protein